MTQISVHLALPRPLPPLPPRPALETPPDYFQPSQPELALVPARLVLCDIDEPDEFESSARLGSSSLSVAVPEPIPPPTFQAASAPLFRQDLSRALTLGRLLRQCREEIHPELASLLQTDGRLAAVLCGVLPAVSVPMKRELAEQFRQLVKCQQIATVQSLAFHSDPTRPDHYVLANRPQLEQQAPELAYTFSGQAQDWDEQASSKIAALFHDNEPEVRSCLAALNSPPRQRLPGPRTPQRVNMIGFVSSENEIQRLHSVLLEWKSNLEEFGHHHLHFTFCDDSPEPYAGQIQAMIQTMNQDSPVHFDYLGAPEKRRLREALLQRLAPEVGEEEARSLAELVAGSGPTQNRNFSLQRMGPQGGLQVDHDMTPEVLLDFREKPVGYDIIQYLEQAPSSGLSSFRYSGANDACIASLLGPTPQTAPHRVQESEPSSQSTVLRAPLHVPKQTEAAARIAPALRDGDLALGLFAERLCGAPNTEMGHYILHRDQAGARWGAAQLLHQYLTFLVASQLVESWLPKTHTYSPQELGQKLLQRLQEPIESWPKLDSLWPSTDWAALARQQLDSLEQKLKYFCGSAELRARLERERDEMAQAFPLDRQDQVDKAAVLGQLRASAGKVLRTQALALIHSRTITATLAG